MKRLFFLLLITIISTTITHAQHCGWDNSYIIILDARDSITNKVINGLNIVLADATGKPYTSESNLRNYPKLTITQPTDTLKFGQNVKDNKEYKYAEEGPFPFGEDCYMLIVYYNNYPEFNNPGTDLILISDPDGNSHLGTFKPQHIHFTAQNIGHLCKSMGLWHGSEAIDRIKINVKLQRKN